MMVRTKSKTETEIVFYEIANESQLGYILQVAEKVSKELKCLVSNYSTQVNVVGTEKQIREFIKLYND